MADLALVVALRQLAVGQAEHAQRGAGKLLVHFLPALAIVRRERHHARRPDLGGARREHRPR
jgi:hypothetical protein